MNLGTVEEEEEDEAVRVRRGDVIGDQQSLKNPKLLCATEMKELNRNENEAT